MGVYDLGDVVTLAVAITDTTGAAANAGSVALTVTLPDGTTASPTVANPATGSYTAVYTPVAVGAYRVRWVATGVNASAYTDAFTVSDPALVPVVSLAEAKRHLNITSSTSDEELRGFLAAAHDAGERFTGRVFGRRTITETHTGGRNALVLRGVPALSVTSVTEAGVAVDPSGYVLDSDAAVLYRSAGTVWDSSAPGSVVVSYVAGYTLPPASDRHGVLEMVRHLWESQRGTMATFPRSDDYGQMQAAGYSIPNRVAELWALNRVPGF